ncbi:6-aminohexanoate hydrolase, partial [Bacillus thuringiensis]|nr:6-aminohexanoate hydrolase [Bacillus thuringiensis]
MKLKKSHLLLLILTFIFVITVLGFTYFKHNTATPSNHNVTKEIWLNYPYLRWSYTHMKEFTLVNNVKNNPDQIAHFPSALQHLDDFAVERRFGNTTPLKKLLDDNKT